MKESSRKVRSRDNGDSRFHALRAGRWKKQSTLDLVFFFFLFVDFTDLFSVHKNESVKNICPLKMSSPSLHDAIALTFFSFESPTCMCALTCFCYIGKKNNSTTSRCTWQLHLPGYLLYDFMRNNPGPKVTWKLQYKKSCLRSTILHDWFYITRRRSLPFKIGQFFKLDPTSARIGTLYKLSYLDFGHYRSRIRKTDFKASSQRKC